MVTEDDLTLGGGHTAQCTDDMAQNRALETCIILVTDLIPFNEKTIKRKCVVLGQSQV